MRSARGGIRSIFLLALVTASSTPDAFAVGEYDLVLRGGRVVDGTGNPWRFADVAVKGDRIALVGSVPEGAGRREIDVRGHIVAPGFIDIHSHSDFLLLEDGGAESKVRQGVTTEVLGESSSAGPCEGKMEPGAASVNGEKLTWTRLSGYFSALERGKVSVNVATYCGLGNVWRSVMGESFARPSDAQLAEMKAVLERAMDDGAMGLSSLMAQAPDLMATTAEVSALALVAARRGGIYSTHIRNEGDGVFEAIKEAIEIGERARVTVDIIHLKIAEQKLWGRMKEVVALIEQARRRGVDIQANVYPYTRGNNDLASIVPPWAHEGGREKLLERLRDTGLRERLKQEILGGIPGWYNHYLAVGGEWSRMLLNADMSAANKRYEGMTMDAVLALRAQKPGRRDPLDELFDLLIEENGSVSTIYAHHTEDDMTLAMAQPWCSIGSDGLAYAVQGPLRRGKPHPRSFGTFPRALGVYVRERGILRLEDAVRKMTSLNASKIGIKDRGLLREGLFADITVFDPEKVLDVATYLDPFQYPQGIPYVIVNGVLTIERGHHTAARAGRPLRRQ